MSTSRRNGFVLTQAAWMLATLVGLLALGLFTLRTYFVLSYIGLLATMQLYAPTTERPGWWLWARLFALVGGVVFAYVIYVRVTEVL